jgi:hypothetical protein
MKKTTITNDPQNSHHRDLISSITVMVLVSF